MSKFDDEYKQLLKKERDILSEMAYLEMDRQKLIRKLAKIKHRKGDIQGSLTRSIIEMENEIGSSAVYVRF